MSNSSRKLAGLLGRFQMGFQEQQVTPFVASAVMVFSMLQLLANIININLSTSGTSALHKFLLPTSFLLFLDFNYQNDPVGPLLSFHLAYLLAFLLVLGSVLASRAPKGLDQRFRAEDSLPAGHLVMLFGILFIPCLLQPLVECTLALFTCGSMTFDAQIEPINRTVFAICISPHTGLLQLTRGLGVLNLVLGAAWAAALLLFVIPRNEVPGNAIHCQSRLFDFLTALQRLLGGTTFTMRLLDSLSLRAATIIIFLLLSVARGAVLLTRPTFASTQSIKTTQFCIVFNILTLVYQVIWVLWNFFVPDQPLLQPHHVLALFGTLGLLALRLIDRLTVNAMVACLRSERMTHGDLVSFYLLSIFARENNSFNLIYADGAGFAEAERLNMHLFQHFMECQRSDCLCRVLKEGREVWDHQSKRHLRLPAAGDTDDFIRLVCSPAFIRAFVRDRLDRSLQAGGVSLPLHLFHLQFAACEERNHVLACCSFGCLSEDSLGVLEQYDFGQLQRVFRSRFIREADHHTARRAYLNVEKFVRAAVEMEKLEADLLDFLNALLVFYGYLGNEALDLSHRVGLIQDLLATLAAKVAGLKRALDGRLPNQQTYFLAVAFYQSISLDTAREAELLIALKRLTSAMLGRAAVASVCARKRFLFDFQNSAVLAVDMDSAPSGRIIWGSQRSEAFFGHPDADFKRGHLRQLLTRRLAPAHQAMYLGYLNGLPSKKVLATGELVFRLATGFLGRKEASVKPFFFTSTVKLSYFTYAETPLRAHPVFLWTDYSGGLEGVSEPLAGLLKLKNSKQTVARGRSVFRYFPGLVDVCFLASQAFRQQFLPLPDFTPLVPIQALDANDPPSFFASAVLVALPSAQRALLNRLVGRLRSQEQPEDFLAFREALFQLSASTQPDSTFQFRVQVVQSGDSLPFLAIDVVNIERVEDSVMDSAVPGSHLLPIHSLRGQTQRDLLQTDNNPQRDVNLKQGVMTRNKRLSAFVDPAPDNLTRPRTGPVLPVQTPKPQEALSMGASQQSKLVSQPGGLPQPPSAGPLAPSLGNLDLPSSDDAQLLKPPVKHSHLNHEIHPQNHTTLADLKQMPEESQSSDTSFHLDSEEERQATFQRFDASVTDRRRLTFNNKQTSSENQRLLEENNPAQAPGNNSQASVDLLQKTEKIDNYFEAVRERFRRHSLSLFDLLLVLAAPLLLCVLLAVAFSQIFDRWFVGLVTLNARSYFYLNFLEVMIQQIISVPLLALTTSDAIRGAARWQSIACNAGAVTVYQELYKSGRAATGTIFEYINKHFVELQYFNVEQSIIADRLQSNAIEVYAKTLDVHSITARYQNLPFPSQPPLDFWTNLLPYLVAVGVLGSFVAYRVVAKLRWSNQQLAPHQSLLPDLPPLPHPARKQVPRHPRQDHRSQPRVDRRPLHLPRHPAGLPRSPTQGPVPLRRRPNSLPLHRRNAPAPPRPRPPSHPRPLPSPLPRPRPRRLLLPRLEPVRLHLGYEFWGRSHVEGILYSSSKHQKQDCRHKRSFGRRVGGPPPTDGPTAGAPQQPYRRHVPSRGAPFGLPSRRPLPNPPPRLQLVQLSRADLPPRNCRNLSCLGPRQRDDRSRDVWPIRHSKPRRRASRLRVSRTNYQPGKGQDTRDPRIPALCNQGSARGKHLPRPVRTVRRPRPGHFPDVFCPGPQNQQLARRLVQFRHSDCGGLTRTSSGRTWLRPSFPAFSSALLTSCVPYSSAWPPWSSATCSSSDAPNATARRSGGSSR